MARFRNASRYIIYVKAATKQLPLQVVIYRYPGFVLRSEARNGGKRNVLYLSQRACFHLVLFFHNVLQNTANHR